MGGNALPLRGPDTVKTNGKSLLSPWSEGSFQGSACFNCSRRRKEAAVCARVQVPFWPGPLCGCTHGGVGFGPRPQNPEHRRGRMPLRAKTNPRRRRRCGSAALHDHITEAHNNASCAIKEPWLPRRDQNLVYIVKRRGLTDKGAIRNPLSSVRVRCACV